MELVCVEEYEALKEVKNARTRLGNIDSLVFSAAATVLHPAERVPTGNWCIAVERWRLNMAKQILANAIV